MEDLDIRPMEKWEVDLRECLEKNGRLGYTRDGIVDEEGWESAALKLVFLTKEPSSKKKDPNGDLRKFLRNGAQKDEDRTWKNVAAWAYCVLHYDEALSYSKQVKPIATNLSKRREWLRKIAAVNIKKQPGNSYTDTEKLKEEFKKFYAPYVAKQLKAFRYVDVIVCCGKGVCPCLTSIFEEVFEQPYEKSVWKDFCHLKNIKSAVKYYKADNLPLIVNYCHPAARTGEREKAMTLKNLIASVRTASKEM